MDVRKIAVGGCGNRAGVRGENANEESQQGTRSGAEETDQKIDSAASMGGMAPLGKESGRCARRRCGPESA
jgi:hypothetical protein